MRVKVEVSIWAFHDDVNYGGSPGGGPPGYDSPAWQVKAMEEADAYFKILRERDGCWRLVGGLVINKRKNPGKYYLVRIFIDPEHQNCGVGSAAMEFLWRRYVDARRWVLDTPSWNYRNHSFYEKAGFTKIGEEQVDGELCLYVFERWMGTSR